MTSCIYCGRDPRPSKTGPKKIISGWYVILFGLLVTTAVGGSIRRAANPSSTRSKEEGCTILVTGTEGSPFQGSYAAVRTGGNSESTSVEGTVPAIYHVKGTTVSTFFAKKENPGSLRVAILANGSVINSSETDAARGSVTVTTQ